MPTAKIYGDPITKGSMKCVGRMVRGRPTHKLVDMHDQKLKGDWTPRIVSGARKLLEWRDGFPFLDVPLDVALTITVLRPPSIPYRLREWPILKSAGDIDKHSRSVLDALTESGLIRDDSNVVHLDVWHCYPDTWACPGRLDRPGISLRIEELPLSGPPPETVLPLEELTP